MAVAYTIGHSTRPIDEFIGLLEQAGVRAIVDVRRFPASRRNPQYTREALERSLADRGIAYRHEPALGGFREPQPGSANTGWTVPAFEGYADYMATEPFAEALERLESQALATPTAVMCAEAQWWRCHRRLIADALVVRGWRVLHLGLGSRPVEHELTPFAVVGENLSLTYPPAQAKLDL